MFRKYQHHHICQLSLSAVDCGTAPTVSYSTSTPETVTVTSYLATVQFDCNTGYEFTDAASSKNITCNADASWDTIGDCLREYVVIGNGSDRTYMITINPLNATVVS